MKSKKREIYTFGDENEFNYILSEPLDSMVLTKDAKFIITVSREGKISFYSVDSGRLEGVISRPYECFNSRDRFRKKYETLLTFDGKHAIVLNAFNGEILTVDIASKKIVAISKTKIFTNYNFYSFLSIGAVAISLNDDFFLVGVEQTIFIYKIKKYTKENQILWADNHISSLAYNTRGVYFVAGSQEGNLVLYMQQPLKSLWSIDKAHNGAVTSLLFTQNSEKIVSAGEDGKVKVWDFHRGELLKLLCNFEQKIKTLRWLEDEKYMVITLEESIVTFCMESLVVVSTIDIASSSKSRAILSSLAKERVAIHTPLHGLELFDIKSTKCTKSFTKSVYGNQTLKHLQFGCGDRAFVQQPPLEISHDSRYVVSALSTQQIALWDMRSVELVSRLGNADKFVSAVTITPDNRYIFSASFNYVDEYISEPSIEIYDVESSELLYVFEIDKKDTAVLLLRITPDGRYLIALLLGGLVMKWDIEKLELVESLGISCHEYDIYAPTISWDGSLLMYALDRESSWTRTIGSIEIVDMVSGNRIEKIEYKITLESGAFLTIEISKDNRYVSLYADNLKLFCWDRVEKIFIYDSKVHHLNNEYNTTMIRSILAPNRNYRVNIYDDEKLGLSVWSMDEATELYRLFVAEKSSSLIIDVEEQEIMVDGEDEVLITSFSSPNEKLLLE